MTSVKSRILSTTGTNIIRKERTKKIRSTFYSRRKPRTKIGSYCHTFNNYAWVNSRSWHT